MTSNCRKIERQKRENDVRCVEIVSAFLLKTLFLIGEKEHKNRVSNWNNCNRLDLTLCAVLCARVKNETAIAYARTDRAVKK